MLTELTVKSRDLKGILSDLELLIPPGTKTVPVGVTCKNRRLYFTVTGVCTYEAYLDIDVEVNTELTAVYSSTSDLLYNDSTVKIQIHKNGLQMESDSFSRFFNVAYSLVSPLDYTAKALLPIPNLTSIHNLSTLLKTPLAALYKKDVPIDVNNEIAMLKYPNLWLQVRVPGFPCNCTATTDCLKILTKFGPEKYCEYSTDKLLFSRGTAKLWVPVQQCSELKTVASLIPKEAYSVKMDIGKLGLILKKFKSAGSNRITVVLRDHGVNVQGDCKDGTMCVKQGSGDFLASLILPIEQAVFCFNLFTDCMVEFVYKDGILCMRTRDVALVIHALV